MLADPILATTARIAHLKAEITARQGSFIQEVNPLIRSFALWRAARVDRARTSGDVLLDPGRSRVQMRAAYLYELVDLAQIEIEPEWRLVGNHLPTTQVGINIPEPGRPEHARAIEALGGSAADLESIARVARRWSDHLLGSIGESFEAFETGQPWYPWSLADSRTVYWAYGLTENHSIRDYTRLLKVGFNGLRQEIQARLDAADFTDPGFPHQENFWRAALSICEAGALLGQRYARAASDLLVRATAPEEIARLEAIREACSRVPAEGARTFREAVQALWFGHILTCGEDGINANSIGRLDQILYPYYQADLLAGRLTRPEALEIMEELACRLYLGYDVQAITLGGVDRQGNDAVNDLSTIILEATRDLELVRDVSVRLSPRSPAAFVELASELIVRGGGIPFIFNDDCFIPALAERGIALEDARNYAPIGCVELTIPGKTIPHAVSAELCSTKCLELALFDGVDPASGHQVGPQTGSLASFASFEDFFQAYTRQVEFFTRRLVYHCNRGELAQQEAVPLPCLSTLTDDCIARGRDITDGGAVYNYHSICFIGTANTADSLLAIKKFVFEDRSLPPETLLTALKQNYVGFEALRLKLLKQAPKYGNDIPEVDEMARRVAEHFIDLMDTLRTPLNGRYFVHLFSFIWHLDFGRVIGATPDGRRAAEPLAYSLAATQGRDEKGVTALFNSLARMPHKKAAGSSAAIVEIDPVLVEGEEGHLLMAKLITTAMTMGIGQLQWNVVTAERLKLAQQDPEHYGNIPVRVSGYSQVFNLVPKDLQDHIIARTKHRC